MGRARHRGPSVTFLSRYSLSLNQESPSSDSASDPAKMGDGYDYRSSDANSAYCDENGDFQGALDDINNGQWPMTRSYSDFPQPQQQNPYNRPAFGDRLSVSQLIPSPAHRSPRLTTSHHGAAQNTAMSNPFTGVQSDPDPLRGYLNDPAAPYSAGQSRIQNPRLDGVAGFNHYRNSAPTHSDLASDDVPALTIGGDSAYASQVPPSVYSDSRPLQGPAFQHQVSVAPSHIEDTRTVLSSERSGHSRRKNSRAANRRSYQVRRCPHCDKEPKCDSDYKKHMLKHEKHFFCDVPNCGRREPFGTVNDLNRHQKSVHKMRIGGTSYRCAGKNCDKPEKIWPRGDNFKQHIIRLHEAEHHKDPKLIEELWKRSEIRESGSPSMKVMPDEGMIAADLAGIGQHQPQTMDPTNMYNQASDLLSPASMEPPAIQDGLLGTGHLHYSSARSPASDRFDKAGQSYRLNSSSADRTGHAVRKKLKLSAPGHGIAALADAALNPPTTHATPDKNSQEINSIKGRASRQSISEAHAEEDDQSQIDGLIAQLKNNMGKDELLETLKKVSDEASAQRRRRSSPASSDASSPPAPSGGYKCNSCNKVIGRQCDLKKHEFRHERAYGCTFPGCNKDFGSKNDWKRHENSQHFQHEIWRCQFKHDKSAPDGKCGRVTWRAKVFKKHLRKDHNVISEQEQTHLTASWRIGRSGTTRYWCGYCQDIIPVDEKIRGQPAWDQRFDHIENHIKVHNKRIEDWLCIETGRFKGKTDKSAEKSDKRSFTPAAVAIEYSSSDESDTPGPPPGLSHLQSTGPSNAAGAGPPELRHFAGSGFSPPGPLSRGEMDLYCCQCNSGPFTPGLTPRCMSMASENCEHEFCDRCYRVR